MWVQVQVACQVVVVGGCLGQAPAVWVWVWVQVQVQVACQVVVVGGCLDQAPVAAVAYTLRLDSGGVTRVVGQE